MKCYIRFLYLTILLCFDVAAAQAQQPKKAAADYATYYVIIAATGISYAPLQQKMCKLAQQTNYTIDTMGRTYDKVKQLIALPADAEDDIYAGEYYPRRYPSDFLSLEYLGYYNGHAGNEKTIALVAGIYANVSNAQKTLRQLKEYAPNAYMLKAKIYIGCMH